MIRFVVISSTMRGAIEPGEPLNASDNATVRERWEMELQLQRETVVWHHGQPFVHVGRKLPEIEKRPKVSAEVLRLLRGVRLEMGPSEKIARGRERHGHVKRIG